MREWAQIVAAKSPLPSRRAERITGWCSWYNLYAYITEENILEHLRGVEIITRREQLLLFHAADLTEVSAVRNRAADWVN
ncbi:MAG: hypothetical protein HY741_11240 [Chloroflexi bacterium]|nr:hypothetical protein [Chloroflexota bacterium]